MTKTTVTKEPELFAATKEAPAKEHRRKVRGGRQPEADVVNSKVPTKGSGAKPASTAVAVHQPQQPRSLMEVIAEASANPNIDVVKMKELLAFKREMEREERDAVLDEAIAAVKAELPEMLTAGSWNKHTKSWWARYEQISKAVDPIIRKHGLVLSYGMAESPVDNHYRVVCDVTHVASRGKRRYFIDGPSDAAGAKGGGTKSPIQGVKSTITYLQRALKCMIFDVIVGREDRDGQGNAPEAISDEQVEQIIAICADKGIDRAMFEKAFQVSEIESIPVTRFQDVLARLKAAPKQQSKKKESDAQADE